MSAPRRRLVLTRRARRDLYDIQLYTERQWGRQQRLTYRARLMTTMNRLVDYPSLGIDASYLAPDTYSYPVEQHVIYYRFTDQRVTVIGILHSKMDPASHLEF